MSKAEFIEHMSALLYRVDDKRLRDLFESALGKYENNEQSENDKSRERMIEELNGRIENIKTQIVSIDGQVEWRNPTDSQDPDVKAVAEQLNFIHGVKRNDDLD